MAGRVFIGTSGYVYPHWRGLFYPDGLPQRGWLRFYARHFKTAELSNDEAAFAVQDARRLTELVKSL